MALPTTGGTYEDLLEAGNNEIAVRKGLVVGLLIRDYNGSTTSLANPAVGLNGDGVFSPFAADGQLRDDLLAHLPEGGLNPEPNLGFYYIGLTTEDGITFATDVQTSDTMSGQSRHAVRVDIESENDTIEFSARESTPLIDWLNDDKPLTGLPDLGAIGYYSMRKSQNSITERQIIGLMWDGKHVAAKVFPRMSRENVGDTSWSVGTQDTSALTYRALRCPYAKYRVNTLREGDGWRAMGGYPNFGLTPPVATQTGATTATVAHAVPSGVGDPWTYEVEQAVSPFTTYTAATIGSSTPSGGNITHSITGLTTATEYKFRVVATGSNGLEGTSDVSNSATTS